ncbi:MAG TPA: MarR family transcriptional regulator [Gammaproteobacteria bacterium]|nr:MarR family transcriptional regulator [Gammaproteobacteria bacterium]
MSSDPPRYEQVSIPSLLRHARYTYATAMREALAQAGHDDIPKNGLYVIGGLSPQGGEVPLSQLIEGLRISKQAAGQLVDALVTRGYLERTVDPNDRRRLNVTLTKRGRAAAAIQTQARETIDAALAERLGAREMRSLRRGLATLIAIGRQQEAGESS